MDHPLYHFLDGGHPGPFLVAVSGGHVQVHFRGLHAEGVGLLVLVLVVRFYGLHVLQGDHFGGILQLILGIEAVQMGFGQHHPPFLPLFEMPGLLEQCSFFHLVVAHVRLDFIIIHRASIKCYIIDPNVAVLSPT